MSAMLNWPALISMQCRVVPMIYGEPGTAKTATFNALSQASDRLFLQLLLGQLMPEDVKGIPNPSEIEVSSDVLVRGYKFLLSEDLILANNLPSVLLLDEFNQCGHDVLGAAQELVNNPPAACWMACVANPVEQSTNGQLLSPPVVNRMMVCDWETPWNNIYEGWCEGEYPEPQVPIVPDLNTWLNTRKLWGKLVKKFHGMRPQLRQQCPADPVEASKPWPSARSWTNLITCCAANDVVMGGSEVRFKLISGLVGEGAAVEFCAFLGKDSLPTGEECLTDPSVITRAKLKRFDQFNAVMGSTIAALRDNKTEDRYEAALDVMEVIYQHQPETAMQAQGALIKEKPEGYLPPTRQTDAAKEMRNLRKAVA